MRTGLRQENMELLFWIFLLFAVACTRYFFLFYQDGDRERAVVRTWRR